MSAINAPLYYHPALPAPSCPANCAHGFKQPVVYQCQQGHHHQPQMPYHFEAGNPSSNKEHGQSFPPENYCHRMTVGHPPMEKTVTQLEKGSRKCRW